MVINALLWLAALARRTGAPWRDLPERFGPWRTVATRFYRWTRIELWDRIVAELRRATDVRGGIDWAVHMVDGTSVRAHRRAAGAPVFAGTGYADLSEPGLPAVHRRRPPPRPGAERVRQPDHQQPDTSIYRFRGGVGGVGGGGEDGEVAVCLGAVVVGGGG